MTARIGFWSAGILLGLVLAGLSRQLSPVGVYGFVFCASVLAIGLLGELVHAVGALRRPPRPAPPANARPADGVVDVIPVAGARGEPHRSDPCFVRFVGLDPTANGPAARPARRGEIPPLLGEVVLISVFLGRDGRPWSEPEIAEAHAALRKAGTWIEREAIRWEAPVNIVLAGTYFAVDDDADDDVEIAFVPEGDHHAPFEAHAVTKALIDSSRAARRLGFRDAADWMAQINPRVEADARVWLLHPRRAGRSLAIPLDETELAGVSLAVCYAREANFPEPLTRPPFTDPVTVVHELLHLFGAADKYGMPLRSFPPRTVTSRDIMRLNETSLARLRIDPQTAREIGWARGL